jgi:hypothetical protein
MAEYGRLLGNGARQEVALSSLSFLFGEDAAEKVKEETEDHGTMMQKIFPKLQCYDCEHCPLAGIHCEYPEVAKILQKLNRTMEHSSVSQEALWRSIRELYDSHAA